MRMRILLAALIVIGSLGSVSMLTGCQSAAEKATEALVEGATGVDVEENGEKVTIEGEDGSSVEIQSGSAELPEDFPSDAPVYDADIDSAGKIASDGTTSWTVMQTTGDEFDDVLAFFSDEFAAGGWVENSNTQTESDGTKIAFVGATKGTLQLALTVQQESGQDTSIGLTVNEGE